MKGNSSVTKLPPCDLLRFFKYWLQFTEPLHKLPPKEIEVLANILLKRYELSKIIVDEAFLDRFVLSHESRKEISESMGITIKHFRVVLSNLGKKGAITSEGRINPRFIPRIKPDSKEFHLMFRFEIDDTIKTTTTNTGESS